MPSKIDVMSEYDIEKLNSHLENDYTGTSTIPVEEIRDGNVMAAILAGLFSCIAVSSVWALITVNAEAQWIFMGIIAGLIVGWFVKVVSGGNSNTIGFIGAIFAFFSCLFGDFLTNVGFIAQSEGLTYFQTLVSINLSYFFEIAFLNFHLFSFIIYSLATIEGWVCGRGLNKN